MQRTDSSISSRPHTAGAESSSGKSPRSRRLRIGRRGLLAVPVALALMAPAVPALAQSSTGTSGYKQEVPVNKETPTKTEPKSGTAPSKESTTPATTTPKASTEPATTTAPAPATTSPSESKLPFTGLDLRWVIGAGMLLLASGLSIRLAQRRQRGSR
jgi:hypothetical protein